jgi:hypothetical protein
VPKNRSATAKQRSDHSDRETRCTPSPPILPDALRPLTAHQSTTPSVNAGEKITRGKYGTNPGGNGSAGPVVLRNGQSTPRYILTCAHVLGGSSQQSNANDDVVYSPAPSNVLGIDCNKPFGQVDTTTLPPGFVVDKVPWQLVIGQEMFAIDVALVEVASNASASNVVEQIGQISEVRDLVQEWSLSSSHQSNLQLDSSRQFAVKKYGASTQYTEGTIDSLARQFVDGVPGNDPTALVLQVKASPGSRPFDKTFDLDMDRFIQSGVQGVFSVNDLIELFKGTAVTVTQVSSQSGTSVRMQGSVFSQPGDSGSAVVDGNNKIIGILSSGDRVPIYVRGQQDQVDVYTGLSQLIFIGPALQYLKVSILQPGQQSKGAPVVVPGMAISPTTQVVLENSRWNRALTDLETTAEGKRVLSAVRVHFEEVRFLTHHRRRVKATWLRYKGPGFVAGLFRSLHDPQAGMPTELDGVRRVDALRAMRDVLLAEGSSGLQRALVEHGEALIALLSEASLADYADASATGEGNVT